MTSSGGLRTVRSATTTEIERVKGSRFVADLAPATAEPEARAFVDRIRQREPTATHHCWAFRFADGRALTSDDGEPRDTAGAPILRRLEGSGLADVVLVVTRYYGGTKLGRGGLIRAYGSASAAAIGAADVAALRATTDVRLAHPYELSGVVDGVIAAHAATGIHATFTDRVVRTVAVPVELTEEFVDAVTEATGGVVRPSLTDRPATT